MLGFFCLFGCSFLTFIYLWMLWVSVAVHGLSPALEWGLLEGVASLVAEHRLWGTEASVAVAHGLVALQHVGSSHNGDRTCVPRIGRQILNRWTTREGQGQHF